MKPILLGLALLAGVLGAPPGASSQASGPAGDAERDHKFVEMLRREDPAGAERYVTLRDARTRAAGELRQVEAQYRAAGPELRGLVLPRLRQAQRQYAEASLALLDYFEARDRGALARYQEEIARITRGLADYERMRAELRKLLDEK
jgi:hypothetical protein